LDEARAKGVFVIYTLFPSPNPTAFPNPVIGDVVAPLAPKGDQPVITSFVDKFTLGDKDTGLQKLLKDKSQRSSRLVLPRTTASYLPRSGPLCAVSGLWCR
jgi:hypothetical protein